MCFFNPDWLKGINNRFNLSEPDMLLLPVVFQGKGLIKMQQTESLGLALTLVRWLLKTINVQWRQSCF